MRAAIVGGGPAGLFTALLLKHLLVAREVVVWERDREANAGFGVILPAETMDLVRRTVPRLAPAVARHLVHWQTTTIRRGRESLTTSAAPDLSAVARSTLNQVLWQACSAEGLVLREREAPRLQALATAYDLVVCADGAGSQADRAGFGVTFEQVGLPYAWLGLDTPLDGLTFVTMPTDGGLYLAHAYPYTETASTFLVEGPRALDHESLESLFGVPVRGGSSPGSCRWRRFRERVVRPWSLDNVVLVGDAAHTAHYSIGYGTHLALEDAATLVESLAAARSIRPALDDYERIRRPAVERSQALGRVSAEWFTRAEDELDVPLSRFAASLLTRGGRLLRDATRGTVLPLPDRL